MFENLCGHHASVQSNHVTDAPSNHVTSEQLSNSTVAQTTSHFQNDGAGALPLSNGDTNCYNALDNIVNNLAELEKGLKPQQQDRQLQAQQLIDQQHIQAPLQQQI